MQKVVVLVRPLSLGSSMLTYPTPVIQPHKSLRLLQILQSHSVSLLFISHASFLFLKQTTIFLQYH